MLSHELFFCVSVELSSRAVASQVFSPLQRLTSVFGMGTGGPTALKTLTSLWHAFHLHGSRTYIPSGFEATISRGISPSFGSRHCLVVHLRGLEPRTH